MRAQNFTAAAALKFQKADNGWSVTVVLCLNRKITFTFNRAIKIASLSTWEK